MGCSPAQLADDYVARAVAKVHQQAEEDMQRRTAEMQAALDAATGRAVRPRVDKHTLQYYPR